MAQKNQTKKTLAAQVCPKYRNHGERRELTPKFVLLTSALVRQEDCPEFSASLGYRMMVAKVLAQAAQRMYLKLQTALFKSSLRRLSLNPQSKPTS